MNPDSPKLSSGAALPGATSEAAAARQLREDGAARLRARAAELFTQKRAEVMAKVDQSFIFLMICQYLLCVAGAVIGAAGSRMPEPGQMGIGMAVLGGAVIAFSPIALALLRPGAVLTRHVAAVCQMLMSGMLIHLSGGRTETHFHVFASLAFLAFYRDWRVLLTAAMVVAVDHGLRAAFWPHSVYGMRAAGIGTWVEHMGWVMFQTTFLVFSIRQGMQMLQNISERTAELEEARDAAERASHAKDEFMAVLSHELRTPLTPSLMTLSALSEDGRLDPDVREEVQMVRRNVELEARLIDDLLDLTRIARGKLQINPGSVDLHALIEQILNDCRPELAEKQIKLTRKLGAQRHWTFADSARLQQVFWNLLRNAVKFTPAGGRIEVRTEDVGERIRVDVVDSGIGIEPEVLPKIFQQFEQGGSATTRKFGGLGLGLSISRAIIEMHHGFIRAESRGRGWGATFTIVLPVRGAPPKSPLVSTTQKMRLSGVAPRRVLLVDDHADTRETLTRLLTRAGYLVTQAGTAGAAKTAAAKGAFDLLLSDIGLPDETGHDLMRELRQVNPQLPGIAFSGFGMEEDVRKSLEAGFTVHLTKPVDLARLKETMTQVLGTRRAPASVE